MQRIPPAEENGSSSSTESTLSDFRRTSLCILSCGGTRVYINASLPLYTAACTAVSLVHRSQRLLMLSALVHGPIVWTTVALHQAMQCACASALGMRPRNVVLWPFGGLTYIGRTPQLHTDLLIALSGPALHLGLVIACYALAAGFGLGPEPRVVTAADVQAELEQPDGIRRALIWRALHLNQALCAFHCTMPCFPLDSARVAADLMLLRGFNASNAANMLVFVSMPIVAILVVYGLGVVGTELAGGVLTFTLAVWSGAQARQLYSCKQVGLEDAHPLFIGTRPTLPTAVTTITSERVSTNSPHPPPPPPPLPPQLPQLPQPHSPMLASSASDVQLTIVPREDAAPEQAADADGASATAAHREDTDRIASHAPQL